MMLYSSTRGLDKNQNFEDVLLNGMAKDGGLYVPNKLPSLSKKKILSLKNLEYHELAFELTKPFVEPNIPLAEYKKICQKTYENFSKSERISIDCLNEKEFILNLFHGPTFAFKDYALQLLGNIYEYVLKKNKIKLTILGATSGDTGSAAIYGCSKSDSVKIFVLFPFKKISEIQRKQMTTFNKNNVFVLAVKGDFDDCQKLVKRFFAKNNNEKQFNLAAINSINWVRIMGQLVYYFWSYFKVQRNFDTVNFVVPTGNFGNVYAGFVAKLMGLPINKLIVASNKNDILTRFFNSGFMRKKQTSQSLSPSMDIQVSSNFERLLSHYSKESKLISELFINLDKTGSFRISPKLHGDLLKIFISGKVNDNDTLKTIRQIYKKFSVILDPHTAVGYAIGSKYLKKGEKNIYLATAHYGKFLETVNKAISNVTQHPNELKNILEKKENFEIINNDINQLEKFLKKKSQ